MTTVYVVRHCETVGNIARAYQGTWDTDISELGAKQLSFLAKRFENEKFDKIFTSPLIRAKKTAIAISGNSGVEPVVRQNLIELCGGVIEGMPYTEIYKKYPELEINWLTRTQDFDPPEGESIRVAYERIKNEILAIAKENKGQKICVACHGGVIRCLLTWAVKGDIEQINEIPWNDNTAVNKLVFDDDFNCTVELMNDVSHLPEGLLPKENSLKEMVKVEK